jgi:hypothetical protein
MKTARYTITLAAIVGFLSIPALGRIEPQSLSERPLLIGRPHPALVGIDGFRAVLLRSGTDPGADGMDWMQLKVSVIDELHQANISLITEATDDVLYIPELRVYIDLLKLGDSRQYAFRVRTSVARSVCLKAQDKPVFKADLWTLNPIFEAVSVNEMPNRITNVVRGQIKAFIRAYRIANPQGRPFSEPKVSGTDPSAIPQNTDTRTPTAGHEYVASNNSDIFHKLDCRWAKNISPGNRVNYKSREQAVKAGKRPCKWCKP